MIRFVAKVVAVLAIGIGAGVLTWGIMALSLGDPIRSPQDFFGIGLVISSPSEAIGWGAGFLAGGATALILSFVGGRKKVGKFGD